MLLSCLDSRSSRDNLFDTHLALAHFAGSAGRQTLGSSFSLGSRSAGRSSGTNKGSLGEMNRLDSVPNVMKFQNEVAVYSYTVMTTM